MLEMDDRNWHLKILYTSIKNNVFRVKLDNQYGNYKTLMRKIKEDINTWKQDIHQLEDSII